jgi:DNA-binding transcriptional ArsR family regulator
MLRASDQKASPRKIVGLWPTYNIRPDPFLRTFPAGLPPLERNEGIPVPFRDPDISAVARIFADATRATIVMMLLDREPHRAGDLAVRARVSPSTASSHLRILLDSGIVTAERRGTQRLFALADDRVARAVEVLASIAPDAVVNNPSLTRSLRIRKLCKARRCYDHLAGSLAIHILNRLREVHAVQDVDGGFLLLPTAAAPLRRLGVDAAAVLRGSQFVRGCEDWTEGGLHLGGPLAANLLRSLIEDGLVFPERTQRGFRIAKEAEFRISMAVEEATC